MSRTDIRYPYIRLVQAGRELPLANYSTDTVFGENLFQGNLDTDRMFELYRSGATMCMQLQHLALPKLRDFTNKIERFFEFRTQSTLFLTPPSSQGFTAHFDTHDFFIFQIYGRKHWKIYDEPVPLPLAKQRVLDSEVVLTRPPSFEPIIQPGDCLYVPRGVYHEALTSETTSLQISLGVFPYVWSEVMHKLIDELAGKEVELRKSAQIPFRSNDEATMAGFHQILDIIRANGRPLDTIEGLKKKSLSKQAKDTAGRLTDLEWLPTLDEASVLQARDVAFSLGARADAVTIFFYDKELTFPDFVREDLAFICSKKEFKLGDLPGSLDSMGRRVLTTKLIEEGLVTFVKPRV